MKNDFKNGMLGGIALFGVWICEYHDKRIFLDFLKNHDYTLNDLLNADISDFEKIKLREIFNKELK